MLNFKKCDTQSDINWKAWTELSVYTNTGFWRESEEAFQLNINLILFYTAGGFKEIHIS